MTLAPSDTADLLVEALGPAQVRTVYPLIRAVEPSLSLADWLQYARRVAVGERGRRGVLVARRPAQRHPSGLVCYRCDRHISHGTLLTAEHFVALDLLYAEAVLAALVTGLERMATELGCGAIRSIVRGVHSPLIQHLCQHGHRAEGMTLTRTVSSGQPLLVTVEMAAAAVSCSPVSGAVDD